MGDFDDDYVEPAPVPYAQRAEAALKRAEHWAAEAPVEQAAAAFGVTGVGWALLAVFERLAMLTDAVERGR